MIKSSSILGMKENFLNLIKSFYEKNNASWETLKNLASLTDKPVAAFNVNKEIGETVTYYVLGPRPLYNNTRTSRNLIQKIG